MKTAFYEGVQSAQQASDHNGDHDQYSSSCRRAFVDFGIFFPLVWPTFVDFGRTFFVVFARLDLYSFRNIFNWTRTSCSDKLLWLICVCGAAQSGMHIGPLPFTRRGLEGRA